MNPTSITLAIALAAFALALLAILIGALRAQRTPAAVARKPQRARTRAIPADGARALAVERRELAGITGSEPGDERAGEPERELPQGITPADVAAELTNRIAIQMRELGLGMLSIELAGPPPAPAERPSPSTRRRGWRRAPKALTSAHAPYDWARAAEGAPSINLGSERDPNLVSYSGLRLLDADSDKPAIWLQAAGEPVHEQAIRQANDPGEHPLDLFATLINRHAAALLAGVAELREQTLAQREAERRRCEREAAHARGLLSA